MRIKITEIEASAEDQRQSKSLIEALTSLSEAFTDAFRRASTPNMPSKIILGAAREEEEDEEDGVFGSTGE